MAVITNEQVNTIKAEARRIGIGSIEVLRMQRIIKFNGNLSIGKYNLLKEFLIEELPEEKFYLKRGNNHTETINREAPERLPLPVPPPSTWSILSNRMNVIEDSFVESSLSASVRPQLTGIDDFRVVSDTLASTDNISRVEPFTINDLLSSTPSTSTASTWTPQNEDIIQDFLDACGESIIKGKLYSLGDCQNIITQCVNEALHPRCARYRDFSDFTDYISIGNRSSMMYVDKFFKLISDKTGIDIRESLALNLSLQNFARYLYAKSNPDEAYSKTFSLEHIQEIIIDAINEQSVAKYSEWKEIKDEALIAFTWVKPNYFTRYIFDKTDIVFSIDRLKNNTFAQFAEYIFEQQGCEKEIAEPIVEKEPEIIETEAEKGLRIARIKFTENRLRKIKQKFINMLPEDIRDMADATLFIAGGAIRDLLQFKEPKDYDFFILEKELQSEYKLYFQKMVRKINKRVFLKEMEIFKYSDGEKAYNCVLSSNAISFGNMQIILKYCGNPEEVVGEFDFKQNMGYFHEDKVSFAKGTKLNEVIDNSLIFNGGRVRNLNNVLLRIPHFIEKGFKISKKEHAKILEAVGKAGYTDEAKEDIALAQTDY